MVKVDYAESLPDIESQKFMEKLRKQGYNITQMRKLVDVAYEISDREAINRADEVDKFFKKHVNVISAMIVGLISKKADKHAIVFVSDGNENITVFDPNGTLEDYNGHKFGTNIYKILHNLELLRYNILYINHRGINTYGGGNCDALCLWYAHSRFTGKSKSDIDVEIAEKSEIVHSKNAKAHKNMIIELNKFIYNYSIK